MKITDKQEKEIKEFNPEFETVYTKEAIEIAKEIFNRSLAHYLNRDYENNEMHVRNAACCEDNRLLPKVEPPFEIIVIARRRLSHLVFTTCGKLIAVCHDFTWEDLYYRDIKESDEYCDDDCSLFFYECTEHGFVEVEEFKMGFEMGGKVEATVRKEMKIVLGFQEA